MVNWGMIGAMVLPNAGSWIGALTMPNVVTAKIGTSWYDTIKKPSWNPPKWVFAPTWTALYTGMGYASYKVYEDCGGFTEKAVLPLALYGGQLLINWTWSTVFFKYHKIGWAFVHILGLDAAVAACTASFYDINNTTLYFMAPYLAWLSFASFLNYTLWKLNKDDGDNKIKPLGQINADNSYVESEMKSSVNSAKGPSQGHSEELGADVARAKEQRKRPSPSFFVPRRFCSDTETEETLTAKVHTARRGTVTKSGTSRKGPVRPAFMQSDVVVQYDTTAAENESDVSALNAQELSARAGEGFAIILEVAKK